MSKHGETKRIANAARLESARTRRAARVFRVILVVALAFGVGFWLRGNEPLMKSLGIGLSANTQINPGATVSGNTYDSLSARIAEIEGTLKNDSLDEYELQGATAALINSLLGEIDDPYLRYFDADRYQTYLRESATADYVGVGLILAEYKSSVYVADVFPDSVAAAAGVQQGDIVVSVDGEPTEGKTASEVNNQMFREAGNSVVMSFRRPVSLDADGGTEYTSTMICSVYKEANVTTELEDTVGYINLAQVTQNSASLISNALTTLQAQGAESFVLDLRDCPSGYLTQAVDIADLFMKSGTIVQISTTESVTTKSVSGAQLTDKPLVVLINEKTAGAAEVIAAALQDSQRARLVGQTTLGRGSLQVVRELSFGGALRYTAAYYLSPLGHDIDGVGVSPDVSVSLGSTGDNQKELAIDMANNATR